VCVTGLNVVDTATHWSRFGQAVILALIELGGLGFMTIASLIVLLVSKRLGLRQQMVTQTERSTLRFGEVREMLRRVGLITLTVQAVLALWLAVRFATAYHRPPANAVWMGLFHSIAAFNNAGFSLQRNSLTDFRADWLVLVPVMAAIIIGGLGFPVLADLDRHMIRTPNPRRRRLGQRWDSLSLHSKLTLATTAVLLVAGFVLLGLFEWGNPHTLGTMGVGEKVLNAMFASVTPRTAGFDTFPVGLMRPASLLLTIALMFIGAGSAGTSGGIKVGTFSILALVIWAQLRGDPDVTGFRRRIPVAAERNATTVALLAVALVFGGTSALLLSARVGLTSALFECVSAFGTVGLSTGITPRLPGPDQLILMGLMLVGRVGPITLGAALVLRSRPTRSRVPEEAPLIG
jgi:trk system potassium uptake protein